MNFSNVLVLNLLVAGAAMAGSGHGRCKNHCSGGDWYYNGHSYVEQGIQMCDYSIDENSARCPKPEPISKGPRPGNGYDADDEASE